MTNIIDPHGTWQLMAISRHLMTLSWKPHETNGVLLALHLTSSLPYYCMMPLHSSLMAVTRQYNSVLLIEVYIAAAGFIQAAFGNLPYIAAAVKRFIGSGLHERMYSEVFHLP